MVDCDLAHEHLFLRLDFSVGIVVAPTDTLKFLPPWARTPASFCLLLWQRYQDDRCPMSAASLTYQSLFAVVPLITVTYSMFSLFDAFSGVGDQLQVMLFENLVPENVMVVQSYLTSFSEQARVLSAPAFALVVVTAFLMLYTIEGIFNDIWSVPARHGLQRFLMYWALLTLGPVLLGAAFVTSAYVLSLPLISEVGEISAVLSLVPFLLTVVFFSLVYGAVPNCRVPVLHALAGGVLAALVFEVAKTAFGSLMERSSFEIIYGAFAAVPLFLLWIYILWSILLLGAELVRTLGLASGDTSTPQASEEAPLIVVLLILAHLRQAFDRGESVTDEDIAGLVGGRGSEFWRDRKKELLDLNLISALEGGELVLGRSLSGFSLLDLIRQLELSLPTPSDIDAPWGTHIMKILQAVSGHRDRTLDVDLETLLTRTAVDTLDEETQRAHEP
ncbi:MAG: YihY family inner membrane protein [Pseudomonadota bacterium]